MGHVNHGQYAGSPVHLVEKDRPDHVRSVACIIHSFSLKPLQRYVNAFTFRLNQGDCDVKTIERMQALAKEIGGKRLPYQELVGVN